MISLLLASAVTCGHDRQIVKTLRDNPTLAPAEPAVVEQLVTWPVPFKAYKLSMPRLDQEKFVYTVEADVIGYGIEADGDIHAVLRGATGATMIAELPDANCVTGSKYAAQMTQARVDFERIVGKARRTFVWLERPRHVRITGVVFFDFLHGQRGAAPDGIELHPILAIE